MVVPSNVNYYADYISPNVDIQEMVIHFKPKDPAELLLRVPIETPDSAIVITLGTDTAYLNSEDVMLKIGLYDSDDINGFFIFDKRLYDHLPPCFPDDTSEGDYPLVREGTEAPSTFKLTFHPREGLGYCETAQGGGYVSFGKFRYQLNTHKPLYLQLESFLAGGYVKIYHIFIESI